MAAGFADPFYENLKDISSDETAHIAFLTSTLGSAAVVECTYSLPSNDVTSFVGLASVLEGVGVSVYLGAAASIVTKDYLTAAGSILTIEYVISPNTRLRSSCPSALIHELRSRTLTLGGVPGLCRSRNPLKLIFHLF